MGFLKRVTKWVTNSLILAITSYDREIRGSAKTRTKLRVFDTLFYSLIPRIKSSSLVGPTILFKYLADFLRLLVLHLCHSCASEEKSWPPSLKGMAGGLPELGRQVTRRQHRHLPAKPLPCCGAKGLRVSQRSFSTPGMNAVKGGII